MTKPTPPLPAALSTPPAPAGDPAGASPPARRPSRKIGLLTFHRCINYGAYWQTRCLADALAGDGHDVEVLDYASPRYFLNEVRHALRPVRPAARRDLIGLMAKTVKFMRAQQRMNRTPMFSPAQPPSFSDFDLIVVGSDEVWNLNHPWLGGLPLFFGESLAPKRLVAYGASFGNYDATKGLAPEWIDRLQRFDRISVRDLNSNELLERHVGRSATLVLDPCLLSPCAPWPAGGNAKSPYLLVYGHNFTRGLIAEARQWARARHLSIVSIGYRNDWADMSVLSTGPLEFIRAVESAAAVVTTYFHGCIFALRFARPFVAQLSDYRANKIRGLLKVLDAEHRIHDPSRPGQITERLSTPIEAEILASIALHRARSTAFLNACLQ